MVFSVNSVPTIGPMIGIITKATNADNGTESSHEKIASRTPHEEHQDHYHEYKTEYNGC